MTSWYPGKILKDGYIYIGIVQDEKDPERFYRLAVAPKDAETAISWYDAKEKYGDRMPTTAELHAIYASYRTVMNPGCYWASTECNNKLAYAERFSDGNKYVYNKYGTSLLRCVHRINYSIRKTGFPIHDL